MASPEQKEEAEKYKELGNAAVKEGKFEEAKKQYNKSIQLDPDNATYYSNRAAAFTNLGNHASALADADRCIERDPNFIKAYSRKGKALFDLGRNKEAEAAYQAGLDKDPNNAMCANGLKDVKKSKAPSRPPSSGSSGGFGGMFGGGFMQQVVDRFKKGGKMQTYMMVMAGYLLYNSYIGKSSGSSKKEDAGSAPQADDDDDDAMASGGQTGRRFKELNGKWVSYMQSESKGDSVLLLLHRTSLSAETEYGSALPQLAKATKYAGFRMFAPDRPCHGFSPCLSGGEPDDAATWLTPLMRIGGTPDKLVVVAAGREAAQQAISLAAKKSKIEFMHLLVVSPKALAPASPKSADMHDWLNKHTKSMSPQATADAARWAAAEAQHKQRELAPLSVDKLPQDFRVTILYGDKDEEDEEFRQSLENQGVEVKTRELAGDYTLTDILVDEVQQALNPDGSGVEKDQKVDSDED